MVGGVEAWSAALASGPLRVVTPRSRTTFLVSVQRVNLVLSAPAVIGQVRSIHTGREEPLGVAHEEIAAAPGLTPELAEQLRALDAVVARLDSLNRALLLLYLEERSYGEIAEILGISETNVATRLSRLKQRIRGELSAEET